MTKYDYIENAERSPNVPEVDMTIEKGYDLKKTCKNCLDEYHLVEFGTLESRMTIILEGTLIIAGKLHESGSRIMLSQNYRSPYCWKCRLDFLKSSHLVDRHLKKGRRNKRSLNYKSWYKTYRCRRSRKKKTELLCTDCDIIMEKVDGMFHCDGCGKKI